MRCFQRKVVPIPTASPCAVVDPIDSKCDTRLQTSAANAQSSCNSWLSLRYDVPGMIFSRIVREFFESIDGLELASW